MKISFYVKINFFSFKWRYTSVFELHNKNNGIVSQGYPQIKQIKNKNNVKFYQYYFVLVLNILNVEKQLAIYWEFNRVYQNDLILQWVVPQIMKSFWHVSFSFEK